MLTSRCIPRTVHTCPFLIATIVLSLALLTHASEADELVVPYDVKGTDSRVLLKDSDDESGNGTACVRGGGEFYGVDGLCHSYSCMNWYQHGPRNFTGYLEESPDPLVCQDLPNFPDVFYGSVSFRCHSLTPEPIQMGFNRKCTANPSGGPSTLFTCYELSDNTDFAPFLDEVNASLASGFSCANDTVETGYPKYTYSVFYENRYGNTGNSVSSVGWDSTSDLVEAYALDGGGMFSTYKEIKTESPTSSPTAPPTPSPVASSSLPSFSGVSLVLIVTMLAIPSMF